jgi:hypothetical protein
MRTLLIPFDNILDLRQKTYTRLVWDRDLMLSVDDKLIVYHDPDNAYDNVSVHVMSVSYSETIKAWVYGLGKEINYAPRSTHVY